MARPFSIEAKCIDFLFLLCFFSVLLVSETDSEVMCCRFNPEGNLLAVGQANGVIKVSIYIYINLNSG